MFNKKIVKIYTFLALFLLSSLPAWAVTDPKIVVEETVTGIVNVLEARTDKNKLTEATRLAIRNVVHGKFDYRQMSRLSLGKEWKKLNPETKTLFTTVFRELLERSYGNRLANYHGQKMDFKEATYSKSGKARVKSFVIDSNKTTPVEYRLHQTTTGWQVYDIRIEGVSLVSTFRKDFKASIKRKSFEYFFDALQKKVERLKAKGKA